MVYDIFLSYPRVEQERAHALAAALTALGLSAWVDQQRIDDGAPVTQSITDGLARSRVLLAWYAPAYARSRSCQWELTAAYLAAQHEGGKVGQRLLIVNPADGTAHVEQTHLKDCQHLSGRVPMAALAGQVRDAVDRTLPPFAHIRALTPPPWPAGPRRMGSSRFVGRLRELWEIHNGLIAGDLAIISGKPAGNDLVRVHGMGGIGKSLLAEEYALRFGAAYPGGIFWLSASPPDGRTTPEQQHQGQMLDLALRLGMEIAGQSFATVQGMLRRHLEGQGRYLWVVDDLPSGANADLLLHWGAPGGQGRTLITSRSGRWSGNGQAIPLDQLDDDAAFDLLTSRRKPKDAAEMAAARAILGLLGSHALAVDVTGAALNRVTYAQMLDELKNPTQDALDLAAKLAKDLPNGHQASVAATVLHSITRLDADAQQLLQLVSLLAIEPIPCDFLLSLMAAMRDGESISPLAAALPLEAAADEGLLERVDDKSVAAHILVTRTIRMHQPASADMRRVVVEVMIGVMQDAKDIRQHQRLAPLLPHALALAERVEDVETTNLLGWIGWFERERGAYATAAGFFRRQWGSWKKLLNPEHPAALNSMNNLGEMLLGQGEFADAKLLHEQELTICRRVQGEEHPDTLASMNNLAGALRGCGDFAGARALQEQIVSIRRRVQGEEHPHTLISMNNLAGTMWCQGEWADAQLILEQVISIQRRVQGEEHLSTLDSMNNLANTFFNQGEFDHSTRIHEHILSVRRLTQGEEHPHTLTTMNNLAESLRYQSDLARAQFLHQRVLSIRRSELGEEHPDTLISMSNLACTRLQMGEHVAALQLQHQAYEGALRKLGPDHPNTQTFARILQQMQSAGPQ